jgi:hypothetical protein
VDSAQRLKFNVHFFSGVSLLLFSDNSVTGTERMKRDMGDLSLIISSPRLSASEHRRRETEHRIHSNFCHGFLYPYYQ